MLVHMQAVTWSDFLALPDDDRRELIDGRLLQLEEPTARHEHIVAMLGYFLTGWRKAGGGGGVLGSGYKVRISDEQAFMPDVQYFRPGRVVPEQGLTDGGPDLAVEVISPSSVHYDQVEKLEGYASIGTTEYWLIDPENRTLRRYVLTAGTFASSEVVQGDAIFRPATFSALEIPLAELWDLPR